jgi:hypothetical protein
MEELIKKMEEEIEEYAYLHGEGCSCMMESPDACDCEEMRQIKFFTKKWMEEVNKYWIKMADAHRPYCRPQGNKMLTKAMGKTNRNKRSRKGYKM